MAQKAEYGYDGEMIIMGSMPGAAIKGFLFVSSIDDCVLNGTGSGVGSAAIRNGVGDVDVESDLQRKPRFLGTLATVYISFSYFYVAVGRQLSVTVFFPRLFSIYTSRHTKFRKPMRAGI